LPKTNPDTIICLPTQEEEHNFSGRSLAYTGSCGSRTYLALLKEAREQRYTGNTVECLGTVRATNSPG